MNADHLDRVSKVFEGSDGDATRALYAELESLGAAGAVAANLFRALKNSSRAKVYRGGNRKGSYRRQAYDRKGWAIENLAKTLDEHAAALGIRWGWGIDAEQPYHRHVLYVDVPPGQVSFHTDRRLAGPDYPGAWDGARNASPGRVIRFTASVLGGLAGSGGTPAQNPRTCAC